LSVKRVEIDRNGKIIVITGDPPSAVSGNEWDDVR
jgi:hypothetical protein